MHKRELIFGIICGIIGAFMGAVVHDMLAAIIFLALAFVLVASSLNRPPARAKFRRPHIEIDDEMEEDDEGDFPYPPVSHRRMVTPTPSSREELLRGLNITRGRRIK